MKEFLKENIVQILFLFFLSLVLIFGVQIISARFYMTANFENIENIGDRIRCTRALGWQVDKNSETVRNIFIPAEITQEFSKYNEIQKLCGFDLSNYTGKGAQVYTYRILNFFQNKNVNAFLNMIIRDGKMIGGDCTVEEYSELHLPVRLVEPDTYITAGE